MFDNPGQFAGCVPIPNRLFDEVLPELTDTELRVLLIVMRSTLGWREGSDDGTWRFKRRDWITHRQLIRRTGRSSASVSSAIQSLIDASLIVVEDASGKQLMSALERRVTIGKLYYGLGVDMWKSARFCRIEKLRTTTNNWNNIKGEPASVDNSRFSSRRTQGLTHVSRILEVTRSENGSS